MPHSQSLVDEIKNGQKKILPSNVKASALKNDYDNLS